MALDEQEILEQLEDRIDDYVNEPYHRGRCSGCTHAHEDDNPLCGDRVRMELKIDDAGTLREVYFDGHGCRISQAAASMLVERFDGRTVDEVRGFTAKDMLTLFGARLTPNRQKCCLLPWRVLEAAIYSPVSPLAVVGSGESGVGGSPLPRGDGRSGSEARPAGMVAAPGPPRPAGRAGFVPASAPARESQPAAPSPQAPTPNSPPAPPLDPAAYRPDFPILARKVHGRVPLVYLDNAATTQRPRQVIQAIVDAYEHDYANIHRGIHTLAERSTELYEQAREKVRRFIHAAGPQEIVFTSGTTAAINLVARSWGDANVRAGDEILVTEMEHHSNLVPWHQLAERTGAVVRCIPLTDDGRLALEHLDRLLGPRTRLVAVTAVSNVLGTINPVTEIVRRAHDAGAVVLVDGAQSVPHLTTDVQAMDCDFLAFSGHKMLGPSGIGVLYGKRELLEAMPPFLGGGGMIRNVWVDRFEPAAMGDASDPRPARFEAGTPPIVPAIALGAAIDYLEQVGLEAIHRHEQLLTGRAHALLQAIPGLRLLGPEPAAKGGVVSFVLAGEDGREIHGHDVAERLDRRGIAVRASHHCAEPLHRRYGLDASIRASFYFYNTLDEVELLGEALREIRHARRPTSGA